MKVRVTKDGLMLDELVRRALDVEDPTLVVRTLDLNPGLAAVAAGPLPYGIEIELPEAAPAAPREIETVKLWD